MAAAAERCGLALARLLGVVELLAEGLQLPFQLGNAPFQLGDPMVALLAGRATRLVRRSLAHTPPTIRDPSSRGKSAFVHSSVNRYGSIKDVRGIYGTLTLTLGEGEQARDRTFLIREARIVGLTGAEWKAGDLREGDRVEVVMAAGDKLVQEVRVLPRRNRR